MSENRSPDSSPRPFATAPDPRSYFPAAVTEEARTRISRCIDRGEGPAVLIGAAGIGKTMLLEVLAEQFRRRLCTVRLDGAQLCTRRALLQTILYKIGLPYRELDEGELRISIHNYLIPQDGSPQRVLLLIDEADSLPERLLEELRVLTNVCTAGQMLVSLVLVGSANLEERFAAPELEVFSQRLATRCYLSSLGRDETFQYVRAQAAAVGNDPDKTFSDEALDAMFAVTDGVLRLINQLGDQLMWTAAETGYLPLDGAIVQQVWSDLQQLPAPWNTQECEAQIATANVVEFGDLSPGDEPVDEAIYDIEAGMLEECNVNSCEPEDDMRASIPITEAVHETPYMKTFDATEHLLQQLEQMDANFVVEKSVDPTKTEVHNPFEESFDSEEVLLDQYSKFESQLLACAPHVVNHSDTDFAQQLRASEATPVDSPLDTSGEKGKSKITVSEEIAVTDTPATCLHEELEEQSATTHFSSTACDVLVIEDEGRTRAEVVSGRQFRQLFSSLQSSKVISC